MNELCRLRLSEEYGVHSDEASDSDAQCLPALWHGTQLASGRFACINVSAHIFFGRVKRGHFFLKKALFCTAREAQNN